MASRTMAEEAVALTPDSMPNQKADLLAELSVVQGATGRQDQHLSSLAAAADLYARKGNVAAVRLLQRP